jgi:hypothetical protein
VCRSLPRIALQRATFLAKLARIMPRLLAMCYAARGDH